MSLVLNKTRLMIIARRILVLVSICILLITSACTGSRVDLNPTELNSQKIQQNVPNIEVKGVGPSGVDATVEKGSNQSLEHVSEPENIEVPFSVLVKQNCNTMC